MNRLLTPLIPITLALTVACGTSSQMQPGAPPGGPLGLEASPLIPDPCAAVQCRWNDLGPQPLTTPGFFHAVSLSVAQNLPMLAWEKDSSDRFANDVFVRVKTGSAWEVATRLNDLESGYGAALAQASVNTLAPVVAFAERQRGKDDTVIRLKTRTVINGASVWKPFDPQSNIGLGSFSTPFSYALDPSVVSIPASTFVAWDEYDPVSLQRKIFVSVYRNGIWRNLGQQADGSLGVGSAPKLVVNSNNRMALSYLEPSALGGRAVVQRWDGKGFAPLPDPSTLGVGSAVVAVASSGEPVVALSEIQGGVSKLVVRQRTGHGSWLTLGAPLNVNPSSSAVNPSVAVSGDQISVAWREDSGNSRSLHVKRWNAATQTWTAFGDAINTGNISPSSFSSLALSATGDPLVAFTEVSTVYNLLVKQWSPIQP